MTSPSCPPCISIIGCGWLGRPLAHKFLREGWKVLGSSTQVAKIMELYREGIEAYHLELTPQASDPAHAERLMQAPTVYLNFPPSRESGFLIEQLNSLLRAHSQLEGKHILFTSSTSVYGRLQGCVDEDTPSFPSEPSGQMLADAEAFLRDEAEQNQFDLTIVRLGGLLGPGRHPARFLSGRTGIRDPQAPVNLVHSEDVEHCLVQLANLRRSGQLTQGTHVFNLVSLDQTPRAQFYERACGILKLPPPSFEPHNEPKSKDYKRVSAKKIRETLDYEFRYDDLLQATKDLL